MKIMQFSLIFLIASQQLLAKPIQSDLTSFLNRFYQNPKKVIDEIPAKQNKRINESFKKYVTSLDNVVELKNKYRNDFFNSHLNSPVKSAYRYNDNPAIMAEGETFYDQVSDLSVTSLNQGKVAHTPWSDTYWPIYKGIIGARYADSNFEENSEWKNYFDFITENPAKNIFASGDQREINNLSPAEKYELLFNSEAFPLTERNWLEGKQYWDSNGKVEGWMGICHGWAQAAFMVDRPTHAFEVMSYDGKTKIKFYPSDVKGLISALWANSDVESIFVGGRCNKKDPKKDQNGRILDSECFDNNPATWHLTMLNRVGIQKRSFVFDATYDYEVWNQPIVSYELTYFNPETLEEFSTLNEAAINIKDFQRDLFKKYRDRQSSQVVGVKMQVTYGVEVMPTHNESDSVENDYTTYVNYVYDLEIDRHGKIIGGEWYQNRHPDFMWTPRKETIARAWGEESLFNGSEMWDGTTPLSTQWKDAYEQTARYNQPLWQVIKNLIQISNSQPVTPEVEPTPVEEPPFIGPEENQ